MNPFEQEAQDIRDEEARSMGIEPDGRDARVIDVRAGGHLSDDEVFAIYRRDRDSARIDRWIPPAYRSGFDGYTECCETVSRLKRSAQRWADSFAPGETKTGLLLSGPTGCGKTHLGMAIIRRVIERGFVAVRYSVPALFDELRRAWDEENRSEAAIVDEIIEADLVMLDDLGVEVPQPWVLQRLYVIVDRMVENEKPLIVTTNYSTDELKRRYGDVGVRIVSRLNQCCRRVDQWPSVDRRGNRKDAATATNRTTHPGA